MESIFLQSTLIKRSYRMFLGNIIFKQGVNHFCFLTPKKVKTFHTMTYLLLESRLLDRSLLDLDLDLLSLDLERLSRDLLLELLRDLECLLGDLDLDRDLGQIYNFKFLRQQQYSFSF